jgi:uncharacterized protein (DUF1697 family)
MANLVRFVALIRAINVGGHTVKMSDLKQYFVDMGFKNVSTVIASGNVIFETTPVRAADRERLQAKITTTLSGILGFEADTFLRTPAELRAIAERTPLDAAHAANPSSVLYVSFLRDRQRAEATTMLKALNNSVDEFVLDGLELYWLQKRGNGESQTKPAQMAAIITGPATNRNITSVRRLAEKAAI